MRYKFILACLILAVISLSLVSAACPSDMIAYWKFDSSSQLGKDYADGHDGTASGDAGFFSGEKVGGGSLDLTNTNTNNPTWISVPFSDDLKFGQTYTDFTIEAWIKPDALGLSAYKGIIGAWAGSGGISFALYNGDLIMWMGNSATTPIIKTKDSVSSIWQHVAITKSGNTYTFYINGVQQELKNCGGTLSGDKKSCDYSGAINYGSTTWQFEIGSDNTISPLADRFIGKIDEVALWKKALSAYEIEQHHNSGNGRDYCTATVPPATCPDSQVIMKISDTTNAHGALWNDANYNTKICYDEIFGSEYTGVNPHDCLSGNANKVVGLNAAGNAHAEVPSRTSYLTNVCYGDLS
ncbi:LamG domain-containing protein, partial [Candidatus Pacearchaeota archaeon]|nr:LamG domain-containing protein [Candidatus Pacearchaeota archaeon]